MRLLSITIAVLVIAGVAAHKAEVVKFPKDQRMDALFPPKLDLPSAPGIPIGHLRPLGHQRRSTGEVPKASHTSWNASGPLIFPGLFKDPQESKIWSPTDDTQNRQVMVTKRSVSGRTKYEKTKLSTFLEHYGSEEWLLQQLLTMEFLEKVKVPKGFECLSDFLFSVSTSLTSGTTSDDMRISRQNKLQCILSGRQDYILMKKVQATPMNKPNNPQVFCDMENVVELDPELVNVFDNPWITAMTWQHASLREGDCILLPAETIVHTTSYGPCETITYSWDGKKKQCKKVKGMSRAAKPHVCANDQNLRPELCEYSDLDSVERWRELLISLLNPRGILTTSCFSELVDDQVDADVLFSWFDSIPVTEDVLRELPALKLKKILDASTTKVTSHHPHDEL